MAQVTINDNVLGAPRWAADPIGKETLIPGGAKLVAADFLSTDYTVVINQANIAEGDTTITVEALPVAIPAGTVLDFGQHTTGDIAMLAKVAANAAAAATSITVVELAHAIENDAEATYTVAAASNAVASGTLIGRTYTERDAGTGLSPAVSTDDEFYIVAFDVTDLTKGNDVELFRPGAAVFEDLLPQWSSLSAALKTKLRATYRCLKA